MFEETIQKLRDYVQHTGNPKPSSRLAYPLRSVYVRTGKPLTKSQFKQFTNEANAILNSICNSEAATDNERETRDILRSLWDQYNHPDSIVTRVDTFNFIAWWIRLNRLERHKSKSSSSLMIEQFLNREIDEYISKLRTLTEEFREKTLELESTSPTTKEVFEVYKLLNFLDSESDLPPQVLTEDQASQLVEYLTACEVQASRVAERISLIQGRVPLLRNLIMSVKLDKFLETLASFSRADITESTRQRETAFQTATPNGFSNCVVQQFLSAAKSIPYIDEPYYFHALIHFSRPFGHLQRREGDVVGEYYKNKLDIFTNVLVRHSVSKIRGLCSTIVNFQGGRSELATLPFGYLYNLENLFNRNSMLGSRQSSYGTDLEMVFRDKKQFIRECAAGEIHALCQNVANEMNGRYAFKYGERYYKWIGFIASLDQVDVMLNVVGYHGVNDDDENIDSDHPERRAPFNVAADSNGQKLLRKFQLNYDRIVTMPDWKTFEPYVGKAAKWILNEMTSMNNQLRPTVNGYETLPVFVEKFLNSRPERMFSGRKLGQYDRYLICRRVVLAKAGGAESGQKFALMIGFAELSGGGKVKARSNASAQFLATLGLTFTTAKKRVLESDGGRIKPEEMDWLRETSNT